MGHSVAEYYSVIRRNKEQGLLQHMDNPSTQDVEVKGSVGTISVTNWVLVHLSPYNGVGRPAECKQGAHYCQFQISNLKMGLNPLGTDCHVGFDEGLKSW